MNQAFLFDVRFQIFFRAGDVCTISGFRIRSAVRAINEIHHLVGPDFLSEPERFMSGGRSPWDELKDSIPVTPAPGGEGYWKIPGEPRRIYSYSSLEIEKRYILYELKKEETLFEPDRNPEALLFSHAFSSTLNGKMPVDAAARFIPEQVNSLAGTGRLCLKRRIGNSVAAWMSNCAFTGRILPGGRWDIYFEMDELTSAGAESTAMLSPGYRRKPGFAAASVFLSGLDPGPAAEPSEDPQIIMSVHAGEDENAPSPSSARPPRKIKFLNRIGFPDQGGDRIFWIL